MDCRCGGEEETREGDVRVCVCMCVSACCVYACARTGKTMLFCAVGVRAVSATNTDFKAASTSMRSHARNRKRSSNRAVASPDAFGKMVLRHVRFLPVWGAGRAYGGGKEVVSNDSSLPLTLHCYHINCVLALLPGYRETCGPVRCMALDIIAGLDVGWPV